MVVFSKFSNMKVFIRLSVFLLILSFLACSRPAPKVAKANNPFPVKYENDLFSIQLPKGWIIEDQGWKGLNSLMNEVDFYDPQRGIVSFHCVKTSMPIKWKNIKEATEMAKTARALSGENVELINEIDSAEIDGYPTSILFFANYVEDGTIIQKQFVTYMPDSHIVIYFNENYYQQDSEKAQYLGDKIISTIKLKKVKNPIEDSVFMRKATDEAREQNKF